MEKKRRYGIGRIESILDYAHATYGVEFPAEFADVLWDNIVNDVIPQVNIVDAIYKEWRQWEKYALHGFDKFMQAQLLSMFKYHACSTISISGYNTYIQNKGVVLKEESIPTLITAVAINGRLTVNGYQI